MSLAKRLESANIPHPQLSKIKQLFVAEQLEIKTEMDEELFSPLLGVTQNKKSHPFITTLVLLILISATASIGWYLGGKGFVLGSKDKQSFTPIINHNTQPPATRAAGTPKPNSNQLLSETEKHQLDTQKKNSAVQLVVAIENYLNYYQKTPWESDKIADRFVYLPGSQSTNQWLEKLAHSKYGLEAEQIKQLQESDQFYIYKPAGSLKDVFTWVCFYPQAHDYLLAAATRCKRDNRLVPFTDGEFIPCQTEDGTIPTALSHQQNLYCVVNDGTHTLESGNDKKSRAQQRDAKRKSDLLTIQQSLIAYYHHHQSYPRIEQYLYRGDNHLTPDYLADLPLPPNHPQEDPYLYLPDCQTEINPETQEEITTCNTYRLCASRSLEIKGSGNISSNDEQGEWCKPKKQCDYYCLQATTGN